MNSQIGPVSSMTGFARQEGGDGIVSWAWEIKSVNGKSLDLRSRLPNGFEALDGVVRATAPRYCARGNLQILLSVNRTATSRLQVNQEALAQLVQLTRDLSNQVEAAPARLDGLLRVPGVLETVEEQEIDSVVAARAEAVEADLNAALTALVGMRRAEGARLAGLVATRLAEIEALVAAASAHAASQPEDLRRRLKEQVEALLDAGPALPEERLTQEVALLVAKADIREELDRLEAHVAAARDLMASEGAIGRKLDFLCQEFNREANTLCSKSPDVALTKIGLDLKSSIEQLREQVQNIE